MRALLIIILLIIYLQTLCYSQLIKQTIRNVNVIDATGASVKPGMTVLIVNGLIRQIGLNDDITIPSDALIIDGTGKFLIPGLWDMHVHLSYYGSEALPLLVRYGVLGVRDMGGDLDQIDQWRMEIGNGTLTGPLIFRSGPFLDGPKNMNAQRASITKIVLTGSEARSNVLKLKNRGVNFIKVHSRVPREAFFAIVDEATKLNIPVVVHVPKDVTVIEASDAGARSIEHTESLLGAAIYEESDDKRDKQTNLAFLKLASSEGDSIFSRIKKNGTWYDPTLVSLYKVNGTGYEKELGSRLLPIVGKLYRAGVPLITGSDFAAKEAGIVPGIDLHEELVLFVKAGMSSMEALQAATLNSAQCLGVSDSLGTIEMGKLAHLILLNGNPLEDIRNTRLIHAVFLNGKVFEGDLLKDLEFGIKK